MVGTTPTRGGWTPSAARWPLTGAAVVGVVMVLIGGLAIAAWRVWMMHPQPVVVAQVVSSGVPIPSTIPSTSAAGQPTGFVVVDVIGRVRHPGLVRLPAGARVDDAVRAAGGVLPRTPALSINLARVLVDGEQIAIAVTPPAESSTAAASVAGSSLDLNTATANQLEELPGVGPVLASRIVEWRTQHTRFASVEQLREVSGVGERKFADIAGRVHV